MTRLLHIEASPRNSRSHSSALAGYFLDVLSRERRPYEIDHLDLWAEDLPEFDGDTLDAKYAFLQGDDPTPEQVKAWTSVAAIIERFARADLYVISTPMWNFSVPYKLKHYIDIIAQPRYTYQARRDASFGEWGLLTGKKAVVIAARGGGYADGSDVADWDFQDPYLKSVLAFMGIKDVTSVNLDLTALKDALDDRVNAAQTQLATIAQNISS